jgi:hypothetical protein
MKLRRRTFLQFAGAGVAAPPFSRVAVAQTYPTLPVPGGPQTPPLIEEILMALYELRTYTLHVGAMAEAVKLYQELGFPALRKGGHDKHLVGYFQADTGTINQIVHLWKFEDDADRRAHWAAVFANKDFVEGFASKFRPLVMKQEVKLLQAAPWGPHP